MSSERYVKDVSGLYRQELAERGVRTPGTGLSQYNGLANLFPKATLSNPNNLEF